MNLDKILSDEHYMFLEEKSNVAFYSLTIGLDEYFETYHRVFINLNRYHKAKKTSINLACKEVVRYVKSYLNIAIHIQHFFELETKRILEKENVLYAVDDKGDPIILHKLLNNISLSAEDTKGLKSVEFSEAIKRLKKLVEKGIIVDEVAQLFADNVKLLNALNQLRNTIIHRGKRIMLYCDLDDLFAQELLPLIKKVLECSHYKWYLTEYTHKGYYEAICKIVNEGKKGTIDYSKIAYEKEMARCKLILHSRDIEKGKEDKALIAQIVSKRLKPYVEEVYLEEAKCPCCENNTMFRGREFIGYDIDELGDEESTVGGFRIVNIPEYAEYIECGLCGFAYTDFIDINC